MDHANRRPTLRDLPLPAKLVLTVFLIAVGLGYLSALVQLHFKHASKGNPLPTMADTVARFSGKPWPLDAPEENAKPKEAAANPFGKLADGAKIKSIIVERCVCCHSPDTAGEEPHLTDFDKIKMYLDDKPAAGKIHKLISAPAEAGWGKDSSMRRAFSDKGYIGDDEWKDAVKKLPPEKIQEILAEREAERQVMIAWLEAGAKREEYDKDDFKPARPPAPVVETRESKAKKRQISVDSLTQSTHAHLLSFAMLWMLTGLIFAFTSYPLWMRVCLSPLVLIGQVADISCWWLARLPDVGPYFALAIMGTGAVVGLGLVAQILLGLFNMYDSKGKLALAFIGLFVVGGLGAAFIKYVEPELAAEKQEIPAP